MKKKVLQILLPLLILTAMVAGCGKNEAAVETTEIVSEATEVIATEETEVTETEDIETEVIEEPETQETETQEPTEETETSTEEKQTDASKETNTTTKETASASESTNAAPQTQETPQTEAAPPAETSSQPVEQTQIVTTDVTGREFTVQGSTGTTSFGTSYAIVSEFNKLGLNPNYDNFFSSDGWTTDFAKAFGEGNKAIGEALGYRSNDTPIDVTNGYIACLDAHITRKPESGYYVWVYSDDLTDDSDGGTSSRAVHQVMLGAITSTPAEVEAALFEDCFGDAQSLDNWTNVGDCLVKFNACRINDTEFICEYLIKPAN